MIVSRIMTFSTLKTRLTLRPVSRSTDYTCEEFLKLPLNERNPEDLLFYQMAEKEKWRRCPKVSADASSPLLPFFLSFRGR